MEELKKRLEDLSDKYFKEYSEIKNHTADKILLIGKCDGINEAIEELNKL